MSDWFQLPHLAGLRIEGGDARAFAHAQFTSSFTADDQDGWRLTAWCNPKGRALFLILARVDESHVDLVVPAAQLMDLSRTLRLYAIGRQLHFSERPFVAGRFHSTDASDSLVIDPGRQLSLNRTADPALEPNAWQWRLADLRAGIAWLNPQSTARYLPQSLGLEERGGLSYRKGCYPGQEIIARVHYLGRQTERLSAFRQEAGPEVVVEDILDETGKRVGAVLDSLHAQGVWLGLAVVDTSLGESASLLRAGQALTLLEPSAL